LSFFFEVATLHLPQGCHCEPDERPTPCITLGTSQFISEDKLTSSQPQKTSNHIDRSQTGAVNKSTAHCSPHRAFYVSDWPVSFVIIAADNNLRLSGFHTTFA